MNNLFKLSTGETLTETSTEFEAGGGFEPLPHNTNAISIIEEAVWDTYQDETFINLKWQIVEGEHKGRKFFQKLKINDNDPKKADKAVRMLAAIDNNCGGNIQRLDRNANDYDLAANLTNKPMLVKLGLWEMDGKSGNWVMAVGAINRTAKAQPAGDFESKMPF